MSYQILQGDSIQLLKKINQKVNLTFLDPPFNQQKDYTLHDDNMPEEAYWAMMKDICQSVFDLTEEGGSIYFMQREKNTEFVLKVLREVGWEFQNLIIWKKKTSAVPVKGKYGKQYQVITYATKGERAKTFHRLRINPELPANYKFQRENGIFVTDVWEDIRELTSGYFAGGEAIRNEHGERFHKQQAPLGLLLRIILSSTKVGDTVLDPFAGTGTTAVTALQLQRKSINIELDPENVNCIEKRLGNIRQDDLIQKYYQEYIYTEDLDKIWGDVTYTHQIVAEQKQKEIKMPNLFTIKQ